MLKCALEDHADMPSQYQALRNPSTPTDRTVFEPMAAELVAVVRGTRA